MRKVFHVVTPSNTSLLFRMVCRYRRKAERAVWDVLVLQRAMAAGRKAIYGSRCRGICRVSFSTLRKRIKKSYHKSIGPMPSRLPGIRKWKPPFSPP